MARNIESRIFVAGSRGMVGSAIVRRLKTLGYKNILTPGRDELNLLDGSAVGRFISRHDVDEIYLAAAKVGGIAANNDFPADFIYENLSIETNIIGEAHRNGVQKLLFLGSSCIYPRLASQPMQEEALLTGVLEPTNEPYAIAKIAGIKLCESFCRQYGRDYRSVMPTNLYGPGDNFHSQNSHVIPALIKRFHEARVKNESEVSVWGSGNPRREFLHVDDMAAACVHVMELDRPVLESLTKPMLSHLNIGSGRDVTIRELANMVARIVGYKGDIVYATNQPDGTPRKLLDVSRINSLGWQASVPLEEGLVDTYTWYVNNLSDARCK